MAETFADQNQVYYNDYFQFQGRSRWMEKIWSEAFGDAYPVGLDHYGYLTTHDLTSIGARLQLPEGATLLDIGCGRGGPGLKLAEEYQLRLLGVDVIPEAVRQANDFKHSFDLAYPASFEVGEFYKIPLENDSVDAVICIDALWAAPNKIQAMMEIKRVMKPGAKFIFTYWDLLAIESPPIMELSGLTYVSREETLDWKTFQQRVYAGILAHEAELVEEMGAGANMLLYEAKSSPAYLDISVRRIYELVLEA